MNKINQILTELSGRRNKECYYVLRKALEVSTEKYPQEPRMKNICECVGERMERTPAAVSKALSRAVEDIWEFGDTKRLQEIYGRKIAECPTPKEFIKRMTEYLVANSKQEWWSDSAGQEYEEAVASGKAKSYIIKLPIVNDPEQARKIIHYLNLICATIDDNENVE